MKYLIVLLPLLTSCAIASGVSGFSAVSGVAIEAKRLDSEGEDRIIAKVIKDLQDIKELQVTHIIHQY
jgi:hypothetical protein